MRPWHNLLPKAEDVVLGYVRSNADVMGGVSIYGSMEVIVGAGLKVPYITVICDTANPIADEVDYCEINTEEIELRITICTRSKDSEVDMITCRDIHHNLVGVVKGLFRHSDIATKLNTIVISNITISRISRPKQSFKPRDTFYETELEFSLTADAVEAL